MSNNLKKNELLLLEILGTTLVGLKLDGIQSAFKEKTGREISPGAVSTAYFGLERKSLAVFHPEHPLVTALTRPGAGPYSGSNYDVVKYDLTEHGLQELVRINKISPDIIRRRKAVEKAWGM